MDGYRARWVVLAERAPAAEIRVIQGEGHATQMLDEHPRVVAMIADWLSARLGPGPDAHVH